MGARSTPNQISFNERMKQYSKKKRVASSDRSKQTVLDAYIEKRIKKPRPTANNEDSTDLELPEHPSQYQSKPDKQNTKSTMASVGNAKIKVHREKGQQSIHIFLNKIDEPGINKQRKGPSQLTLDYFWKK
jgi:hypothetical protein